MSDVTVEITDWAEENFGTCEPGDTRRTRRAVQVARQMAEFPDGSTPNQCERWADLKAAYRLLERDEVTFEALATPHWKRTRSQAKGTVLLIGDTMETNFGGHRHVEGFEVMSRGSGQTNGFFLHSSLMVQADDGEIVGLAGQELFYRKPAPKNEDSKRRYKRPRESEVWGRVIDQVGPPPANATYVHVFDRGADNVETFWHLIQQKCNWVIRAAQLNRNVYNSAGRKTNVRSAIAGQRVLGRYDLEIRGGAGQVARMARLEVRAVSVALRKPARKSQWLRSAPEDEISQWLVDVREVHVPAGAEPLRWVLWTSLPIHSFEDAWDVIEYYERRWLVEEYHKAIKTGCRLESRQYQTAGSLEALTAITSVLAVRLVQLKTMARAQPNVSAAEVVPGIWLKALRALRKRSQIETVRDFFRHLAGLGGHLMRKGDGEPGWITIWRGTDKLLLAIRGHYALRKRCG